MSRTDPDFHPSFALFSVLVVLIAIAVGYCGPCNAGGFDDALGTPVTEANSRAWPAQIGPATLAQGADGATTAIALAHGATEANQLVAGAVGSPVGLGAVIAGKLALAHYGKTLRRDECRALSGGLFGLGAGAAASNLLVLAGAGAAGPLLAIPVGLALWYADDKSGWWKADCPMTWESLGVHTNPVTGKVTFGS